jgi:ankyrin repeat protein
MRDHITDGEAAAFAEAPLNRGARVIGRDDLLQSTALGWACCWSRVSVVQLMLESGGDPVESDSEILALLQNFSG